MKYFKTLGLALLLVACTRDLTVGTDFAVDGSDGLDGSAVLDAGSDNDAASDANDAANDAGTYGCGVSLEPNAATVAIEVANEPYVGVTPSGEAPLMVPGRYDLIAYKVFWGGKTGTGNVRETLVITGSPTVGAMERVTEVTDVTGQIVASPLTGEKSTYRATGASAFVTVAKTCPGTGSTLYDFGYDGEFFVLGDQSTSVARLYRRR